MKNPTLRSASRSATPRKAISDLRCPKAPPPLPKLDGCDAASAAPPARGGVSPSSTPTGGATLPFPVGPPPGVAAGGALPAARGVKGRLSGVAPSDSSVLCCDADAPSDASSCDITAAVSGRVGKVLSGTTETDRTTTMQQRITTQSEEEGNRPLDLRLMSEDAPTSPQTRLTDGRKCTLNEGTDTIACGRRVL